jgi:hypothetical protein
MAAPFFGKWDKFAHCLSVTNLIAKRGVRLKHKAMKVLQQTDWVIWVERHRFPEELIGIITSRNNRVPNQKKAAETGRGDISVKKVVYYLVNNYPTRWISDSEAIHLTTSPFEGSAY